MTGYFKIVSDGFVLGVGTGNGGLQITQEEYQTIVELIQEKPSAPSGYTYMLTEALEWQLVELPPVPPVDDPATPEDYEDALSKLGVSV